MKRVIAHFALVTLIFMLVVHSDMMANPTEKRSVFQSTVSGSVIDSETGETMPGVNVAIENSTRGTATDSEGSYSLEVDGPATVLIFSFVGYETQQIIVEDRDVIHVELVPDLGRLDEVIVVGYGTVRRSDLTGSVQRVTAEEYRAQSTTQLTEMLSGTVPGLYSRQGTSASGGSSMEIRGPSSLTAGTSPMVVLDGAVYNGSLSDINPNDIESIDILKDASAAAIYGAKAASGVILITTSQGTIGPPRINYSSEFGISQAAKHRRPLDADQFLQFRGDYFTEITRNDPSIHPNFYSNPNQLPDGLSVEEWRTLNDTPNDDPFAEYLQRLNLYTMEQENALAGRTVDWYPMAIREGFRQSHNLSLSGGTENSRYYLSLGYVDNEGVIRGDDYGVIRSRLNLDFTVTDWLALGANTQFSERDESSVPANLSFMYIASPFGESIRDDGTIRSMRVHEDPSVHHPLMDYYGRDRSRKVNSLFSTIYADLQLPFGIEYRLSFQPRFSYTNEQNFWGIETITGSQSYDNGYATRANSKSFEWMVDNLFSWNRQIGVHQIDLTFLLGAEKSRSWSESLSNSNFSPNPNLGFHGIQYGNNPALSSNDVVITGDAALARINYTLMDRYLLTASLRRDGFSAFGQEEPRAYFPAMALAWQISEEDFYNIDWMDQLKVRFSWGVNGNRDIGAYSALAVLQSHLFYDGTDVHVGVENSSLANPGLVWEKTEAFNIGIDVGLFENRIDANLDFYIGTTSDLLMNRQLPQMTGFSSVTTNLGELENRGVELSIRSVNVNSTRFSWSSDLVFSLNRNKIVSLFGDTGEYRLIGEERSGELPDFTNRWFPGQAVDVVWGYDVIGIWQEEEAEEAAVYGLSPGDFKAVDVTDSGSYDELDDKQFIGHTSPRYRFGFRNNFSFGNLSASIFIRADLGHLTQFNEALTFSFSHDRRNYQYGPMPYWTAANRNNEFARLQPNHSPFGGGLDIYKPASFVRIQDLTLSYQLSPEWIDPLHIRQLSIFGAVRNLHTFDQNFPGWDPESRMSPMPRTFTLGIEMSL